MADGRALFRCDASPQMGGGHAVRCLALADALGDAGWRAAFAGSAQTPATVPALARSRHRWVELPDDAAKEPAILAAAFPQGCDLLVADHYERSKAFESACRPFARRILAVSDSPGRDHDCDLLLDPTPGRKAEDYPPDVPAGCGLLLGPSYALLRRQFAERRDAALAARRSDSNVARVMVSLGATDPAGLTAIVLQGIADSGLECAVDAVLGAAAPHLPAVRELLGALGTRARLHVDAADMAGLMANADLAIGAAGATSFERCALGLPSLVVVAADNQKEIAAALIESGAAVSLGTGEALRPERVAAALREIAGDIGRRAGMSRAAALLCDGRGAQRTAIVLAPERADDGGDVVLRPAALADGGIMLAWQRHPATRRYARDPGIPSEAGHWAWLERKLADPDCLFNIIVHDRAPAGILRLDRAAESRGFEVSILVAPEHHRLGLGRAALELAGRLVPEAELLAEVHPENAASHSLFLSAGFHRNGNAYHHAPRSPEMRQ